MKNIFKKNQMIITALAIMIAVAGYLNYSGSKLDSAKVETDADASTGDDAEAAADISAEDIYAQTGLEELQFADGDIESLDRGGRRGGCGRYRRGRHEDRRRLRRGSGGGNGDCRGG